jgi:hypothetical protein
MSANALMGSWHPDVHEAGKGGVAGGFMQAASPGYVGLVWSHHFGANVF